MAKKTKLPNGLRIVTDTNKSVESVVVAVGVKVGNRHEDKKTEGISHALEHLLFKGTKTRTYQELNDAVDFVGASTNAYTSNEQTVYYIKTPKEHIEMAVDILSDQVLNSIFPEEEMKKEMEVIEQEIKRAQDDPNDMLYDRFMSVAFKGNQLSRPILGTAKQVLAYTPQDMLAYYKKHYHPKNMVVSVAGNVKHADVVELVKKYFTPEVTKFKSVKLKKPTWNPGQAIEHVESENQVSVMIGFPMSGRKDLNAKQQVVNYLVNDIMSSGMNSRLFAEIREKRGLVYSVGSWISDYEDISWFGISGGTDHEKVDEFIEATAGVLATFEDSLVQRDLEKAKNSFKAKRASSLESISSVAIGHINSMQSYKKLNNVKQQIAIAETVTLEDLKQAFVTMIAGKPVMSVYGFVPQHQTITVEKFEKLLRE